MQNQLYYGDNLYILRKYIAAESVDLIYLDPPFNSSRNYILTIEELLRGKDVTMPPRRPSHQEARAVREDVQRGVKQKRLI